jgi:uncharacterized membrane protein YesL
MNNNRLVNTLNTIVDYFLLNLLWFIVSIPLITVFPATAALFGVVRQRHLEKDSRGILIDYFTLFRDNFKQSFAISLIWAIVGAFLYIDYLLINPTQSLIQLLLFVVLWIGIILFSVMSIYLFPIIVHFKLTWKNVIRNAFLFSLMNPLLTVMLLVISALGIVCMYTYPATIFIVISPLAYFIYNLCHSFFNTVVNLKDNMH